MLIFKRDGMAEAIYFRHTADSLADCFEVMVIKGKAKNIKRLVEELIGTKGVKHGKLMTTTTGKDRIQIKIKSYSRNLK